MRGMRSVAALVLTMGFMACAPGDADTEAGAAADTGSAAGATEPAGPGATQPGLPVGDGLVSVDVTLTESEMTLSNSTVQAGLIALRVHNTGSMPHRVKIEGGGEEYETEDLAPGGEVMMTVNLSAGEYTVTCTLDQGHGTLPVLRVN
jgi:plastocyanin